MPKMKTKRSAAKRFSLTKNGKIKRSKANANHKFTKKTSKRKRHLRQGTFVAQSEQNRIERLLP